MKRRFVLQMLMASAATLAARTISAPGTPQPKIYGWVRLIDLNGVEVLGAWYSPQPMFVDPESAHTEVFTFRNFPKNLPNLRVRYEFAGMPPQDFPTAVFLDIGDTLVFTLRKTAILFNTTTCRKFDLD